MKELEVKLIQLRDQTWLLARESLDIKETATYRSLTDIAEKLTNLIGVPETKPVAISQKAEMIDIFARYKDERYEAQLDRNRIERGRGRCVRLEGKWWTASGSANHITHTSVNGWRHFWRYDRDGVITPIEELKNIIPGRG